MLVLTRQNQECIRIGRNGEILVKILCNNKGQVRVGIEAPRDIPVDREEVFWRKHAALIEKKEGSQLSCEGGLHSIQDTQIDIIERK